jgi:hypothetical protein
MGNARVALQIGPVAKAIAAKEMFQVIWCPPGPWAEKSIG